MDNDAFDQAVIPFPSSRFFHYDNFRYYYAYGNTPAEDLLRSVVKEEEPSVLVLGCGDMRSCFYTLWKHFSSYSVKTTGTRFHGAYIVLNDYSAAVLARNILFLYLAVKIPWDKVSKVCAMWAIWFCHELHPEHERVLKDALASLLEVSSSISAWSGKNNILKNVVEFGSPNTLVEVHRMWKMWLEDDFGGVSKLTQDRAFFLECSATKMISDRFTYANSKATEYKHLSLEFGNDTFKVMQMEIVSYIEKGSVFAEEVLGVELGSGKTAVNPTLFERLDHSYTLHYTSLPFDCFYHMVEFSKKSGITKQALSGAVKVKESCFQVNYLLANSVQQFSVWVQAVQEVLLPVLDQLKPHFLFKFFCSDALHFCQQMHIETSLLNQVGRRISPAFDTIHSSNLIDFISLPAFILSAFHLLKSKGILFTSTFWYTSISSTAEEYLKELFGFECELLPVLCGVQCIGHEGRFADLYTTVHPTPCKLICVKRIKPLLWQKIDSSPLNFEVLSECKAIENALYQCIQTAATSFFQHTDSEMHSYRCLCIETAMQVILSFISQLGKGVSANCCQFWESLSSLIRNTPILKPFLVHLQTQALLHKIHLHLTLSKANCPLCNDNPVSAIIAQYSIVFDPMVSPATSTPAFPVFIHKEQDERFVNEIPVGGLQLLVDLNVHIVDSSSCLQVGMSKERRLDFFLPIHFAVEGYYLTVIKSTVITIKGKPINCLSSVCTTKLSNVTATSLSESDYHFSHPRRSPSIHPVMSSFGSISQHTGDQKEFITVISLSEGVVDALKKCQGKLKVQSSTEFGLKVLCSKWHITIQYPYPVEYNASKVQWSRSRNSVTVHAPRKSHSFWKYQPVFVASPDNRFCFPSTLLYKHMYSRVACMQYSKEDYEILDITRRNPSLMPLEVNVKETFQTLLSTLMEEDIALFQREGTHEILGLVMFQNAVFHLENDSPAVDLYFHLAHKMSSITVFPEWFKIVNKFGNGFRFFNVSEEEMVLLRYILINCATRTRGKLCKDHAPLLQEHKIMQHFSRAVIYPLYTDPDKYFKNYEVISKMMLKILVKDTDMQNTCHGTTEQQRNFQTSSMITSSLASRVAFEVSTCDFCHSQSSRLKKCSRCGTTAYCNKDCQRNHWKEHRLTCQQQDSSTVVKSEEQQTIVKQQCLPNEKKRFEHVINADKLLVPFSPLTSSTTDSADIQLCSYCCSHSFHLRKCSGCGKVSYCSKNCQCNHWKEHRLVCQQKDSTMEMVSEEQRLQSPLVDESKSEKDSTVAMVFEKQGQAISTQNPLVEESKSEIVVNTYSSSSSPLSSPTCSIDASKAQSCNFCRSQSFDLKKCTRCGKALYCSKDCQQSHWKEHRLVCQQKDFPAVVMVTEEQRLPTKMQSPLFEKSKSKKVVNTCNSSSSLLRSHNMAASEVQSCAFCNSQSLNLKKCSHCDKSSYCSKDCQRSHWKEHKQVCHPKNSPTVAKVPEEHGPPTNVRNPLVKETKSEIVLDTYSSPSTALSSLRSTVDASKAQSCDFCSSQSFNLKKCTRCGNAYYCNKECQHKHWKEHQLVCQQKDYSTVTMSVQKGPHTKIQTPPIEKSKSEKVVNTCKLSSHSLILPGVDAADTPSCDFCHSQSLNLKKCSRCSKASYCSRDCQHNHWKLHRIICQPVGKKTCKKDESR